MTLDWSRVERRPGGCWLWLGPGNGRGYGKHRGEYVHRLAYREAIGPIPEGLELDHLCRVRSCVNPDHLEAVTHRENTLRGETLAAAKAAQTHCIAGHPFDERNTRRLPDGTRTCRRCRADRMRRYREEARHADH